MSQSTMSRQSIAGLAKASWIIPLLYVFGNRFVALVIGRVLADLLVFVIAVLAVLVAIFCMIQVRTHGAAGILGHAIAGIAVSGLLLAIWIPNFLAARQRARAAGQVHSARRNTISECDSTRTSSPARSGSGSRRSGTGSFVSIAFSQRSPHGPVGSLNVSASL